MNHDVLLYKAIVKKYRLTQPFRQYLAEKYRPNNWNYVLNNQTPQYHKLCREAIIDWYEIMMANRKRLLAKTKYNYLYANH